MLSAKRDHGHARSGIDAAADEEQIVVLRALLWRFEGEVTAAIADHTVDGASIGGVASLDVEWGPEILYDDVLPQIGEAHALKLVEAEFFKRDVIFLRVGIAVVDRWNVRQDLDVVAAGWRLRWIAACGGDNIDSWIVRQVLVAEDAAEVLVEIGRVEEVVMCEPGIDPIQPKVQNDTGARWFKATQLLHNGSGRAQ